MKKAVKIISVNILILVLMFFIIDYISLGIIFYDPPIPFILGDFSRLEQDIDYDSSKKSIITLGCSFTYGEGIEPNETLAYKLQQATNRKVYNRGVNGWGPQFVLKDIQTSKFFNEFMPETHDDKIVEPEYVIYTFIPDHVRRIYSDYFSVIDRVVFHLYDVRGNKLVRRKNEVDFTDYINLLTLVKRIKWIKYLNTSNDKKFDRIKLYFYAMKDEINKRFPDTKFVIIIYNSQSDISHNHSVPFTTTRWNELENDGFIVLNFDTPEYNFLADHEFLSQLDFEHPGPKAWDALVPIIVDRLGLKE